MWAGVSGQHALDGVCGLQGLGWDGKYSQLAVIVILIQLFNPYLFIYFSDEYPCEQERNRKILGN